MSDNLVPLFLALSCGGIFILALGALGIFLIVYSIRSRKKAEASQSWPSTVGRITTAEVRRSASTDDDGVTSYSYYPSVEYEYQIGGQAYTGKRIAFGAVQGHSAEPKAAAELARFPAGSQVEVSYNPEKPTEAVLERRAGGFTWGMVVGVACLALGACIACPLLVGIVTNLLPKR